MTDRIGTRRIGGTELRVVTDVASAAFHARSLQATEQARP